MTEDNNVLIRTMATTTVLILVCATLVGCGKGNAAQPTESGERAVSVRVQSPREMTFARVLELQGSLESASFALVPARTSGTIDSLLVEEGDAVTNGQILCELDCENLQRAFDSQRQELAVASNELAVAEALAGQAKAAHALAQKDLARFQHLVAEDVVSVRRMDEVQSTALIAAAALDVAVAQVELSRVRVGQVGVALAIARRNLADATVRAPIAGLITLKHRELGEMVERGNPVFRIDDPEMVEISVYAPAQFYGEVIPGETTMRIEVDDAVIGDHKVSYRSPTVDEHLRTFEVKARIGEPSKGVVAGKPATARLVLEEHEGWGVPDNAIITRGGQAVVLLMESGRAREVPVKRGLRTDGFADTLDDLPKDAAVIVQGQQFVNDGDAVAAVED